MFISDFPSAQDDRSGIPVSGQTGREFDNYLRNIGLRRDDYYVTCVVKCRPQNNNPPEPGDIVTCSKTWLDREIREHPAEIVVAMGYLACNAVFQHKFNLDQYHGFPQYTEYCFQDGTTRKLLVMPILHPAYGLYQTGKMYRIQRDFEELRKLVAGIISPDTHKDQYPIPNYQIADAAKVAEVLFGSPQQFIFVDTETLYDMKTPWSVQFAVEPGSAYFVKAEDTDAIAILAQFIADPNVTTVLHNAKFDLKVLAKLGIVPAQFTDSMIIAYNLQGPPQGLKALAYRYCGMQMQSFGAVTRSQTNERFRNYFTEIATRKWPDPQPEVEWSNEPQFAYDRKVEKIPCTKRHSAAIVCDCVVLATSGKIDHISKSVCEICQGKGYYRIKESRGAKFVIPGTENGHWKVKQPQNIATKINRILSNLVSAVEIDLVERWNNFSDDEKSMVEQELGPLTPCDLSSVDFDKALYYACRDADATCRVYWSLYPETLQYSGLDDVIEVDNQIAQMTLEMEEFGMPAVPEKFQELSNYYQEQMDALQEIVDCFAGRHINIGSQQQVAQYLFEDLGIKPEKFTKGEEPNPSTDAEALMFIEHKHPVIPIILQWRGYAKNKSSFADKLPTMIEADGRIRGNIKVTRTATGRLAMDEPNLMNIPTRTEEGKKIRECFVCPDGYSFVSSDYGQIEMRVACHDARDKAMTEIFIKHYETGGAPEWDIHRQTAARIFGIPVSAVDEDKHRTPAKSAGFGILNQITGQGLADFLVKVGCPGWSPEDCDNLIKEWFSVYPDIRQLFRDKELHARRYGYVTDMFGKIYRMPEYKSALKNVVSQGQRNTCNYFVQGGAQGIMKRGMLALRNQIRQFRDAGIDIQYLVQIHDDMICMAPDDTLDWYVPIVKSTFESAVKLSIPLVSDCKVGKSWGSMKKVKK
jgi:uracil-DNA glycosylase family 4